MHYDDPSSIASAGVLHCHECARKCVGSLLSEFGWRSEVVAGKTRWRCAGCLGSAPDIAALFKTAPGSRAT